MTIIISNNIYFKKERTKKTCAKTKRSKRSIQTPFITISFTKPKPYINIVWLSPDFASKSILNLTVKWLTTTHTFLRQKFIGGIIFGNFERCIWAENLKFSSIQCKPHLVHLGLLMKMYADIFNFFSYLNNELICTNGFTMNKPIFSNVFCFVFKYCHNKLVYHENGLNFMISGFTFSLHWWSACIIL